MQTFLPYGLDFKTTATVLDRQRLGKQRVETYQILCALTGLRVDNARCKIDTGRTKLAPVHDSDGEIIGEREVPILRTVNLPQSEWRIGSAGKGWINHSVTRMWRGHERWLMEYQRAICQQWTEVLGYADTCFAKSAMVWDAADRPGSRLPPQWIYDSRLALSHKASLVLKAPDHYQKLWPGVKGKDDYWWPVP